MINGQLDIVMNGHINQMTNKWDIRFIKIAKEVSTWSKDPSKQIGTVVVKDRRILSTGYNGLPYGMDDDLLLTCSREEKLEYIIHGEVNCIMNAAKNGISLNDSTIYVWGLPICNHCAKAIVQSGIKNVVMTKSSFENPIWQDIYNNYSNKILSAANIGITIIDDEQLAL